MTSPRANAARLYSPLPPVPKPARICHAGAPLGRSPGNLPWARLERARIETEIASISLAALGFDSTLRVRDATPGDFERVRALIERTFGPTFPTSSYQLMWALRCGRGGVIETTERELMGVHLETPAADLDHSSYSILICVDPRLRGFRLGGTLARYTGLRAFMGGARVRRGIVAPTNLASCVVLLHDLGANFVRLHAPFADFGAPRFEYALELSRAGLSSQCVDERALAAWLDTRPATVQLIPVDDHAQLASVLEGPRHHVVALCRERAAYVVTRAASSFDAPSPKVL